MNWPEVAMLKEDSHGVAHISLLCRTHISLATVLRLAMEPMENGACEVWPVAAPIESTFMEETERCSAGEGFSS
jgi:hypothetical protein